ncbi:MAG: hypothetical protein WBY66_01140 [Candidatus Acidiferrales bacterium]
MGREFIGECPIYGEDPELESYESELAVRFIKRESGKPPRSVDVQLGYEDSEYGGIPAIVVIWDDYETGYPQDYIQKCIDAFERFELPEEIHQQGRERADLLREIHADMENWFEPH